MREAVILGAARTAIARENGGLRDVPPETQAALVMKTAVTRSGLADPLLIDEVIFGHCLGAPGCIGRMALLRAGLPMEIPSITIDRQCGSGSTAVNLAATHIRAGVGDVYLAGGVESMTRMPYMAEKAASAYQRMPLKWIMPRPLSPEEVGDPPMGITAENIVARFGIPREEQDEMAFQSQLKANRAIQEGRFQEQIVPVPIPRKNAEPLLFQVDEHPRQGTTVEALSKLRPAFKKDGSVTAGNSSGINDGSGALLLASREKAEKLSLKPLAVIRGYGSAGVDPNIMGMGPVPATRKALAMAGLTLHQMDVIELNEAFAAQAIACCRELEIDWRDRERFNPNGGAIALGHPIAGSLAILTIKALYELRRRGGRYALITACCGGGQGVATIIENADC